MPAFWVVGEAHADGSIAKISTEIATLARGLAADAGDGGDVVGIVVAPDPARAARELAAFAPRVLAVTDPAAEGHAWAVPAAESVAAIVADEADGIVLVGAGPDGRDVAGTLAALTGRGVLANAVAVCWDERLRVDMSAFGGKLVTTSGFTGPGGIVTVRPNLVTAGAMPQPGEVVEQAPPTERTLPRVAVRESVAEAGTAVPIEEARIIVSGGRGIGGPDGFGLVQELADELERLGSGDMDGLTRILSGIAKASKAVLFEGNGYSEEWHREAERRGEAIERQVGGRHERRAGEHHGGHAEHRAGRGAVDRSLAEQLGQIGIQLEQRRPLATREDAAGAVREAGEQRRQREQQRERQARRERGHGDPQAAR